MGEWDNIPDKQAIVNAITQKQEKPILYTNDDVKNWMTHGSKPASKVCCLVYGKDGTGKTGLVFDFLNLEDVKNGYKMVVIDLDGGGMPLKETYHKDKGENLIVIDPLVTKETEEGTEIDYQSTFAKIRAIIRYVRNNYIQDKIKAIVFDGLSTALSYAEQQMRLDKHLDVDGGVQTRYWLMRNKLFLETLEQVKGIPIAKFFIAHENFVAESSDPLKTPSSVIMKTHMMMWQKIRCERKDSTLDVNYTATIDKSKYGSKVDGAIVNVCRVDKSTKTVKWNAKEVFKILEV